MLPMLPGKSHVFTLELRRDAPSEQWGFSLVGGADQKAPLIVTRVGFHSPVANTLEPGDIIKKIGNYDARDIRHQDAQNLFKNGGTNIKVVVQREPGHHNTSTASSLCSSALSSSPALSPRGPVTPHPSHGPQGPQGLPASPHSGPLIHHSPSAPISPHPSVGHSPLPPFHSPDPFTMLPQGYHQECYAPERKMVDYDDIENVLNQPYRTTPLVLPGAKVKREGGPTESYLRHHPNPTVRNAPHHVDNDYAMKQRVADSVIQKVVTDNQSNLQIAHKQFNSPIQLYTEQNIVDTIKHQSGITTISKKYDPLLSETYKAIQEEENELQDVSPIAPKVFTPPGPRVVPAKKQQQVIHHPPPHSPPHHLNSLGGPADSIQQSGSFKRLMYHVMTDI